MGGLLLRLRTWWETADRTQKTVTLFGGAFLAILLLGTFYFASKPKLQVAFTGLSMQDMGKVTEEIAKLGIPYEMDASGGVSVPADKIPEVKAKLAVAGKLPTSGSSAGDMGPGSAFEPRDLQQERQRARLEAEIGEAIIFIEGVDSARVKIAPANNSLFVEDKKPATAAITIIEKSGGILAREQVQAIANLVAYSTPDLDTNHVTITNQRGQLLWEGLGQDTADGKAQKKLAAEIAEGQRRERKLQGMLDQAFGAGTTIANVNVVLDFNIQESRTSTPTVSENASSEEVASEKMEGTGKAGIGGPTGTDGNATDRQPALTGGGGKSSSYEKDLKTKLYPQGNKEDYQNKATGSLTGMTVTILADSGKLEGQDQALQNTVNGFIGPKVESDTENFKSTVEMVKFDTSGADAAKKAAAAGAMGDKIQQVVSILPIVALLLVGFMVVKAISKAAKDQTVLVQALPDGRMIQVSAPLSLGTSTQSSGGGGDSSASSEPGASPAVKKAKPEIGDIPDNVNVPLEQIKKMSVERPEAVAMLIKSWLLEDRR